MAAWRPASPGAAVLRLSLAGQHGRGAIARPPAQITIHAASVGQPKPRIHRPVSEPVESKWLIMPDGEVPDRVPFRCTGWQRRIAWPRNPA